MRKLTKPSLAMAIGLACNAAWSCPGLAWGDEGHEVIALVAQQYLTPAARKQVNALLAADPDPLTAHDIADAATWADKFRDSGEAGARAQTRQWHFVDLELSAPDLQQACFGRPPLPAGTPASAGPANDCAVDKIDQFQAELANPATNPSERIVALKFLLHLVGDLHQPLHASDDHDRGGNNKRASASGLRAATLHHFWDTEFVDQLGPDPKQIAASLIARVSAADQRLWSRGDAAEWAVDSFRIAKADAYGRLPAPNTRGSYRLPDEYVAMAKRDVAMQLTKAGVRLAWVLNRALDGGR
jgi:hypothetical protein